MVLEPTCETALPFKEFYLWPPCLFRAGPLFMPKIPMQASGPGETVAAYKGAIKLSLWAIAFMFLICSFMQLIF